jgi:hypothetical protein
MKKYAFLGITLAIALVAWTSALRPMWAESVQQPAATAASAPAKPFVSSGAGSYATEEQWIAGETARALIEMASYANGAATPDASIVRATDEPASGEGAVRLAFHDGNVLVVPKPFIWAPATFRELAASRLAGRSGSSTLEDKELIAGLLGLNAETIRTQNARVSKALQGDFTNPAHHESAALLLAAFSLREASGTFSDVRRSLGRMTAHLALADALRGTSTRSLQGRLAEAALLVLAGRQRDAVAVVDELEAGAEAPTAAWIRVLRMRMTRDWRAAARVTSPSAMERFEEMTAVARTTRTSLLDIDRDVLPDMAWRRLEIDFSVGEGNQLAMPMFLATLDEAGRVLAADPSSGTAFVAALERSPATSCITREGSTTTIQVIDKGLLASFYDRHVAFAADRALHHFAEHLASKDRASQLRAMLDQMLPGMSLLPAARRLSAHDAGEYRSSMNGLAALVERDASRLSFDNWAHACRVPPKGVASANFPCEHAWYRRRFPVATYHDPLRLAIMSLKDPEVGNTVDRLFTHAPWSLGVIQKRTALRCKGACTEAQLLELYGPLADYVTAFGVDIAYAAGDNAAARLRTLCDMDGELCFNLADWFVSRDRFPEAAATYEEYIRRAEDQVHVSNRVTWLAQYYFEQGRIADALRVAQNANRVGSRAGMQVLARHYELTGDNESAKHLYREIVDRYDAGQDLLAFYLRQAHRESKEPSSDEYRELRARYFPNGLRRVSTAQLIGSPVQALRVRNVRYFQQKAGFRQGDVVVAIDGIAVTSLEQWQVGWESSLEHLVRVTLWRDGKYMDIDVPFRKYNYGLELGLWNPAIAAKAN